MSANKVQYADKVGITPKDTHINQVWDDDMNEIKLVVNDNADLFDSLETEVDANTLDIVDLKEDITILDNPLSLTVGDTTNNVTLGVNGIRMNGTATIYDDLRVPVTATRAGGTKDPDFSVLKDNGLGSQGVFAQWFDKSVEEELYFSVQMPHARKEGSNIFTHVHWTPKTTGVSGNFVRWGLEYIWSNVNEVYGDTTIIYSDTSSSATATISGDDIMTANKHHISVIGDGSGIDGTGKTLSSMLVCRIFRDATNAGDDYNYDAGLLEVDFHYEMDSFGSDEQFTKI